MSAVWPSLILGLLLLLPGTGQATKETTARLKLVARDITKGLTQGDRAYGAMLTNDTPRTLPVEVVQMPPGYLGGGTFYNCSLQLWDGRSRRWRTLHPNGLADAGENPQLVHTEIKPHEQIEVCRRIVFRQESHGGKCGRFAFSFTWHQRPAVFSDMFRIPDPEHPGRTLQCSKLTN